MYRVIQIPIDNSKKGNFTVLADNLIGYPDNLKIADDGNLLVAFCTIRDFLNVLVDNTPKIRKILINLRLPEWVISAFANTGLSGGVKINPVTG